MPLQLFSVHQVLSLVPVNSTLPPASRCWPWPSAPATQHNTHAIIAHVRYTQFLCVCQWFIHDYVHAGALTLGEMNMNFNQITYTCTITCTVVYISQCQQNSNFVLILFLDLLTTVSTLIHMHMHMYKWRISGFLYCICIVWLTHQFTKINLMALAYYSISNSQWLCQWAWPLALSGPCSLSAKRI